MDKLTALEISGILTIHAPMELSYNEIRVQSTAYGTVLVRYEGEVDLKIFGKLGRDREMTIDFDVEWNIPTTVRNFKEQFEKFVKKLRDSGADVFVDADVYIANLKESQRASFIHKKRERIKHDLNVICTNYSLKNLIDVSVDIDKDKYTIVRLTDNVKVQGELYFEEMLAEVEYDKFFTKLEDDITMIISALTNP